MDTHHPQSPLRWGILGCGRVARSVIAPGIARSPNGVLHAVASRELGKAQEFAAACAAERAYGSYEELLADPDVQAVYIALPNSLHMEWTIRAAEQGKHVLCDKALALNAEEADAMVNACRAHNVQLMVGYAYRFHPQTLRVKELIDAGRIGTVTRMTSVHSTTMPAATDIRLNPEMGGGILGDMGCYCINGARFLFDAEPTKVLAILHFADSGVEDRAIVILQFPEDRVAQFESSYHLEPGTYMGSYELFGTRGHIHVPMGYSQVETYREGKVIGSTFYVGNDAAIGPESEKIECPPVHQWEQEVAYFAERILSGQPIGPPAEYGSGNMRVMDAIFQSAREDRFVELRQE
jgi:xylose dehydrogenase (NAD/NADP)